MKNIEFLLEQIDLQYQYLLNTRSIFPYMDDSAVGKNNFRTAPFYREEGFNVIFSFNRNLNENDILRIRSIGHWTNENYLIRLCALLESHEIIPKENKGSIDKTLEGSGEVDILRRLRNQFAHTSGRYNPEDSKEKRLYKRIVEHFKVKLAKDPDEATTYPISIDLVIKPITEKCKKYIIALKSKSAPN